MYADVALWLQGSETSSWCPVPFIQRWLFWKSVFLEPATINLVSTLKVVVKVGHCQARTFVYDVNGKRV